MKTFLPFRPHHAENSCLSGKQNYNFYHGISFCLLPIKNVGLALVLFNSIKSERRKPSFLYLGNFEKWVLVLIKGKTSLGYGIKI